MLLFAILADTEEQVIALRRLLTFRDRADVEEERQELLGAIREAELRIVHIYERLVTIDARAHFDVAMRSQHPAYLGHLALCYIGGEVSVVSMLQEVTPLEEVLDYARIAGVWLTEP